MTAPRDVRKAMVERDGPNCRWCGRVTHDPTIVGSTAPDAQTLDHVVPRSRGGAKRDPGNGVIACYACNQDRGSLVVDEWAAVLVVRAERAMAGPVAAASRRSRRRAPRQRRDPVGRPIGGGSRVV